MYKYCLFIIILLFPIKSFCDGLVKKSDNNLLILNENNGKVIIQNIYSVDKNKGITQIQISPSCEYISFAAGIMNIGKDDVNMSNSELIKLFKKQFFIINNEGIVIYSNDDGIVNSCWSQDSKYVACIIGDWSEDSGWGFIPKSMCIIEVVTGNKEEIEINNAMNINWAKHENCIYYRDTKNKVFKIDPDTKVISSTNVMDIWFSPSGKYYYKEHWEDYDRLIKCENGKNEDINIYETLKNKYGYVYNKEGIIIHIKGWVEENDDHLLIRIVKNKLGDRIKSKAGEIARVIGREYQYLEYDPDTNKIVKEYNNVDDEWISGKNKKIVTKDRSGLKIYEIR